MAEYDPRNPLWRGGRNPRDYLARLRRMNALLREKERLRDAQHRADQRRVERGHHQHHHHDHRHSHQSPHYASHWTKRSSLSHYVPIDKLNVGGLSESIKKVRDRRSGTVRIVKRVAKRARPMQELDILKRIPKGCHLNVRISTFQRAVRKARVYHVAVLDSFLPPSGIRDNG